MTSSGFIHVSTELKNKDEYSQVLFSGFCRKVQYGGGSCLEDICKKQNIEL